MSRRVVLAVLVLPIAAAVAGVVVTGSEPRGFAFGNSVPAATPVVDVPAGPRVCQGPIDVPAEFDTLEIAVDAGGRFGAHLTVDILDHESQEVLVSQQGIEPNTLGFGRASVTFGPVEKRDPISVCLTNDLFIPVRLWGVDGTYPRSTRLTVNGEELPADIALRFYRLERPESALAQAGRIAERAALFHPGWTGEWTFWALLVLLCLGCPALLALAVLRASGGTPS